MISIKTLWSKVNEVPPPPPGQQPKAFLLMEMPGFSVDLIAYDPTKFHPGTMMSPEWQHRCAIVFLIL